MPDDDNKHDRPEVVLTPAGPVPKDQVHFVNSGGSVRRDPDGSYSLIPPQSSTTNEGGSSMGDELVLTPGGYRAKSTSRRWQAWRGGRPRSIETDWVHILYASELVESVALANDASAEVKRKRLRSSAMAKSSGIVRAQVAALYIRLSQVVERTI